VSSSKTILIAAASGRALAAAARRSHYRPLVADLFGDLDTRALAAANVVAGDMEAGFEVSALVSRVRQLADAEDPIGLVYGSGFEDRTEIIDALSRRFPIFGNRAEVVARAKDPRMLARLCHDLGVPHPEIRFDPPADPDHWLIKRQGGGGGLHIAFARARRPGEYYQRRVEGTPISVLFIADGHRAQILGTSRQWTAPSEDLPFRYGGAVRPALLDDASTREISCAAERLATGLGLVGLNSADFLVAADAYHLLEINPRPGATLDIFAHPDLFAAHLESCRGHLPSAPLIFTTACATAIAYAPCDLPSVPALDWPDWCLDRQRPQTRLAQGDPVCTIFAEAKEPRAAQAIVAERLAALRSRLIELGPITLRSEESAA